MFKVLHSSRVMPHWLFAVCFLVVGSSRRLRRHHYSPHACTATERNVAQITPARETSHAVVAIAAPTTAATGSIARNALVTRDLSMKRCYGGYSIDGGQ